MFETLSAAPKKANVVAFGFSEFKTFNFKNGKKGRESTRETTFGGEMRDLILNL